VAPFYDLAAGLPLRIISDEGVVLGRMYRNILLEKK